MSNHSMLDLTPAGITLFDGFDAFLNDLSEDDESTISGGGRSKSNSGVRRRKRRRKNRRRVGSRSRSRS